MSNMDFNTSIKFHVKRTSKGTRLLNATILKLMSLVFYWIGESGDSIK